MAIPIKPKCSGRSNRTKMSLMIKENPLPVRTATRDQETPVVNFALVVGVVDGSDTRVSNRVVVDTCNVVVNACKRG